MNHPSNISQERIEALEAKVESLERKLLLQGKAAYKQEDIVAAMGLSGEQRRLLDLMKKVGLLHSPIKQNPLTYPGAVVRAAIKAVDEGKVRF